MDIRKILEQRYPREVALRTGNKVTLRLLSSGDEEALGALFGRMSVEERELFMDDVTDPSVIRKWCRQTEYGRVVAVVAESDGRIVGDATLHRNRLRASRHVAHIRISVDPDHRGVGLGKAMTRDLCELAPAIHVAYVDADVMPQQERAIAMFESLDFVTLGTLPQRVRDISDRFHDIVLLTRMAMSPQELCPDGKCGEDVDLGGEG